MSGKLKDYQMRLVAALTSGDLPAVGVSRVALHHDRKCRLLRGGNECTCTPEISIHSGDGDVAVVAPDGSVNRAKRS